MPDRGAALLRAYWAAMNSNDFASAAQYLAPDITIDWPQSNERITGRADFIALNSAYPANGLWRFEILSLHSGPAEVITTTDITDSTMRARAITFSRLAPDADLIAHQTEYWPEPYPAPENRRAWTSPLPQSARPMTP